MIYILSGNDQIERITEAEFAKQYCEVTTAPVGVVPKYHLRGLELWTWGHQGSFPKCLRNYDTLTEARKALHEIHFEEACQNSYAGNAPSFFGSIEEVVEFIVDLDDAHRIYGYILAQASKRYAEQIRKAAISSGIAAKFLAEVALNYDAEETRRVQERDRIRFEERARVCAEAEERTAQKVLRKKLKKTLSVSGNEITFNEKRFAFERKNNSLVIDRAFSDELRQTGLKGESITAMYDRVNRMVKGECL